MCRCSMDTIKAIIEELSCMPVNACILLFAVLVTYISENALYFFYSAPVGPDNFKLC